MRAKTIAEGNTQYSTKVWKDGDKEPAQWQMVGNDVAETIPAGAIAFVVHHSDVTLCKVSVVELKPKQSE